jgi:hypothetical protein
MRFEQRSNSWPHHPSERLGEGVYDLVTIEPEQSGSFFSACSTFAVDFRFVMVIAKMISGSSLLSVVGPFG